MSQDPKSAPTSTTLRAKLVWSQPKMTWFDFLRVVNDCVWFFNWNKPFLLLGEFRRAHRSSSKAMRSWRAHRLLHRIPRRAFHETTQTHDSATNHRITHNRQVTAIFILLLFYLKMASFREKGGHIALFCEELSIIYICLASALFASFFSALSFRVYNHALGV